MSHTGIVPVEPVKSEYNASQIKRLSEKEKIVENLGMYIGRTDEQGVLQQFKEVYSNSIDEFLSGYCSRIDVLLDSENSIITVSDNGRGIPIGYQENGVSTIEEIFTTIHMGGKFDNGDATKSYEFSGGMHGVGSCLITYVSDFADITVKRDGYIYNLRFENGELVTKTHIVGTTDETGTTITWRPSRQYLDFGKLSYEKFSSMLKRQHFLTKGLQYNIQQINTETNEIINSDSYLNTTGLSEYIDYVMSNDTTLKSLCKTIQVDETIMEFENPRSKKNEISKVGFAFKYVNQNKCQVIGYTNNIHQPEGGTHVQGLCDLVHVCLKDACETASIKLPKDVLKEDFLNGMIGVIAINLSRPTLEGQTKNKLGDTFVPKLLITNLKQQVELALLSDLKQLEHIANQIKTNVETRRAIENIEKATLKKVKDPLLDTDNKLVDAESKDRKNCELFIVEGDSAGGGIEEMRDSQYQAIYKLKGKPLNCIITDTQKVFDNKELKNLIYAIGTGIGKNFDASKARYGKIFILSDSDSDGGHIQSLMLGFFKHLMPQLFVNGLVFKVVPPLYGITTGKGKKIYVKDRKGLDEWTQSHTNEKYLVTRFKGLGEMEPEELYATCIEAKGRIIEKITDIDSQGNGDFVNNILGKEGEFKYNFLKNYESVEVIEQKKKVNKEIEQVMSETMYDYGIYANQDRAIPHLEDGLKPVHKRILWAMKKMGANSSGKTVKSARVVGEVIGKFHPHGDTSVFGAAVKLTQNFYMRDPLLNKQGNFGSVFGFNNYADARYSEMKLSKFSEDILLSDLSEKDSTVDFRPTYDGTLVEPMYLPAKLPTVLLLPSFGIGFGMSCDIPPQNSSEVIEGMIQYIQDPTCDVTDYILGPDFPMIENQIISTTEEIKKAYKEGGSIRYRVKLHHDPKANTISIHSLPYTVEFNTIYNKLTSLVRGERRVLKGTKEVIEALPFNRSLKAEIKKVSNHSGTAGKQKESPVNIVLELNKTAKVEIVMAKLYKLAGLETTVNFRPVLINRFRKIKQYNLQQIVGDFVTFRREVLTKQFQHHIQDLTVQKVQLETKVICIQNLNKVVTCIQNSTSDEQAVTQLVELLKVLPEQAEYILGMTLRSLKNLELSGLLEKIKSVSSEIEIYTQYLGLKEMNKYMIKELKQLNKLYGSERRTEIIGKQESVNLDSNIEAIYEDKEVTLLVTSNNLVYKVSGRDIKVENRKNDFYEEYGTQHTIQEFVCNNRDKLYVIQQDKGYSFNIGEIKEESTKPLNIYNNKLNIDLPVQCIYTTSDLDKDLIVLFENENIARVTLSDITRTTQGFSTGTQKIKSSLVTKQTSKELDEGNYFLVRTTENDLIIKHPVTTDIPRKKSLGTGLKVKDKIEQYLISEDDRNVYLIKQDQMVNTKFVLTGNREKKGIKITQAITDTKIDNEKRSSELISEVIEESSEIVQ